MKGIAQAGSSLLCVLLVVAMGQARAADPAPQAVALADQGQTVAISNGVVAATFGKSSGELVSLRSAQGAELLGNGGKGYFDATLSARAGMWSVKGGEFRIVRQAADLAEIAFIRRLESSILELHYVLRSGESGFYLFVVHRHEAAMPAADVAEVRYVLRADPAVFNYAWASDARHGSLPPPDAVRRPQMFMDATYRLPDGTVYTKYDWADFMDRHWGHGLTGQGVGVWIINGANEYLMGGPTKQELTVHATDSTPVALAMFTGSHFLGREAGQHVEGDWAKLYGPTFIYITAGELPQAMHADARRCADRLAAAWPYRWLRHPLYPLDRGKVAGRLRISDGSPAGGATIILAAPSPDWQAQWKDCIFWTHADSTGAFTVPNVRPGTYTLYSLVPGVLGEFRRDQVTVKPDDTTDLGQLDWTPPSRGRRLWQVGSPDRTAGEFRHGDAPRQYGLWNLYPKEFPGDVNFIIGRSAERTDWNYAQLAVQDDAGRWRVPTWTIRFTLPAPQKGKATLSLAIAGADGDPGLRVLVNGTEVASLRIPNDSSIRRSATQAGYYRLHLVEFDAAVLKAGENAVALELQARVPRDSGPMPFPAAGIMYDCVRLEVEP
jgi:rhamnogalacturonan endolyase